MRAPQWVWVVIVALLVLWILGQLTSFLGGLINILLVVALILVIVYLVQRIKK